MNITLLAKSENPSHNILIKALPFLIGRDESPFSQFMQESQDMNRAVHHISRQHATIYEDNGKILIKDLGSKNGTNLNDQKLGSDPVAIDNGDIVRITKRFEYTVRIEQESRRSEGIPFSLTLLPADNQAGLRPIEVTSYPFHIGRKEDSFLPYERTLPDQVVSLSRKHARINYRGNRIYIEDLGSTNGTALSGEPVGKTPKLISHGDQIVFGQFFKYVVRLFSEDVEETIALESETIKEPDRTIVIGTNKANTAPTGEMAALGEDLLEASPPPPDSDKKIVFVAATRAKESTPVEAPAATGANQSAAVLMEEPPSPVDEEAKAGSTVYMSSATQFLKILTPEEKDDAPETGARDTTGPPSEKPEAGGKNKSRIMGLIKEIYRALSGTPAKTNHSKWFAAAIVVIVMGAVVVWGIHSRMPEQRLKKLRAAGHYIEYLKLSDQILAKNPDNEDIRRASTDALMRASLPDFSDALKNGRIDSARQIITSYGAYASNNLEGQRALQLLTWIVDIESYFAQNDPDKPINLFKDEVIIEPIVSRWDANEDDYRFIMDQMVQRSDTFEPTRSLAYHHLNVLKLKSIYFDSVKALNRTIQTKIDAGRNDEILSAIDEYKRKYPNTQGLSELRMEAGHFQTLDRHIRARDVVKISAFLQETQFQTPVFEQRVDDLKKNILPNPELGIKMTAAAQHWSKGNSDQAFSALEGLIKERWGDLAEAKMNHYRQVVDLVAKVNSAKGTPEHSAHLLALRAVLDPEEDQFYAKQVEGDFVGLRDQELQKSQQLMNKAVQGWSEYLESGRITGLLRLESSVSKNFTQRANQLKSCYEQSRSGVQIYNKLDIPVPDKWERLNSQIADEVIAQRLRIEDLAGVLGPEVSTAKLALLPSP